MNDPLTSDLFPQSQLPVMLQGPADLDGFRRAARSLLAQQMLPEQVSWHSTDTAVQDLFADARAPGGPFHDNPAFSDAPAISVPPDFMKLCEEVILHSDPNRFGLLYRILWRLVHEPGLRQDPLDADRVKAGQMAQAVRRDMHKMKAFVRFRTVLDDTFKSNPEIGPLHVAWFEPEHHIIEAVAPFFARRFAQMRWAILTPEASVEWNGGQLRFGPGGTAADAPPPDAGEQLWLTYYQHIFNPARLKMQMMQKEMPRKYWKNLPEAELIYPLAAAAQQRSTQMIEQEATVPARRIPPAMPIQLIRVDDNDGAHANEAPCHAAHTESAESAKPGIVEVVRSHAALQRATNRCRECPIGEHATQSVCGEGPRKAGIMLVGEQPGDQEDLAGKPFVGPAGQLLDRALAQLGIARDKVFVANAVKHFKYELRGKRRIHKTPTQREIAACSHWLEDEIAMVQPTLLVALGATAARSLLGKAVPVMANRGQILEREDGRKVLVTLHPSALLRVPQPEYEQAYRDWLNDLSRINPH
ncbi:MULTISPECIES: UdgX family uracil-DNA binding protein [unclassified Polaromonas]|uniref:UdgX family uracil-DNA binding protein n=1 Tax=unclassified Polaromonas TaxID=2638319 RepID=UPI001E28322F|nr:MULTISPECIES: UdgX family uracil-DNA binding protein [unclassified Polaromonas]